MATVKNSCYLLKLLWMHSQVLCQIESTGLSLNPDLLVVMSHWIVSVAFLLLLSQGNSATVLSPSPCPLVLPMSYLLVSLLCHC